jgi:hypothetical protein
MPKPKPAGLCPNCKKMVRASVVEENTVRRDMCSCPACKADLLVCRTPGCDDYARGGEYYDDELCPACTKKGGAVAVGLAAGAAYILSGGKIKPR